MSNPIVAIPSEQDVQRIAALDDAVLRNLQITQCYHELAKAIAARTGPHANWCTFATWASKQAGQTIRQEDLARSLAPLLASAPEVSEAVAAVLAAARRFGGMRDAAALRGRLWQALDPAAAMERSGGAVARGNLKVFAEIGREFARFAAACLADAAFDEERIARFCDGLRDGDPPEGQRYLRQAFARYYRAFFEDDAERRAELMLLANLEIGLHEQTRLQPEIAEALEAPVPESDRFAREALDGLFPYHAALIAAAVRFMRSIGRPLLLDRLLTVLNAVARRRVRLLLTAHLMTLTVPREVRLRLGDDLRANFPEVFRQVEMPDLCDLLGQIDPTPDSLHGTGAADWADLPERLHFIADLFRCYGESPELWDPPFTTEQAATLGANKVPGGAL